MSPNADAPTRVGGEMMEDCCRTAMAAGRPCVARDGESATDVSNHCLGCARCCDRRGDQDSELTTGRRIESQLAELRSATAGGAAP